MAREDIAIKLDVVETLLREPVVGKNKVTVDTAKKRAVASHEEGRAEELIREMMRTQAEPLEAYGGSRDNVRLTSVEDAVEYLEEHGGDVPFGYG